MVRSGVRSGVWLGVRSGVWSGVRSGLRPWCVIRLCNQCVRLHSFKSLNMESQSMTTHQELDAIMGTTTRIPRLLSAEGFPEWKYHIEKYIKMKDLKIWRSI